MHFPLDSVTAAVIVFFVRAYHSAASRIVSRDPVPPPSRYYLQSKIVENFVDTGSNKDGLWVYSFHTADGLGDAVLSSNKSIAMEAYMRDGMNYFIVEDSPADWPFYVAAGPVQLFHLVTISVSAYPPGGQGYYFTEHGLQYNNINAGWLVCDWWHNGEPQLFSINGYEVSGFDYPSSCSQVELHPVAVDDE